MAENQNTRNLSFGSDIEPMMPVGWAVGDDFTDPDSWTGGDSVADVSAAISAISEGKTGNVDVAPTTEQTETGTNEEGANAEAAPTTEQSEATAQKLRFKARFNHQDQDVEMDESELPTVWQKAQVTDSLQSKVNKQKGLLDQAQKLSTMLGFETIEEMLKSAEDNYVNDEVERIVQEGGQRDLAEYMVRDKLSKKAVVEASEPAEETPPAKGRDLDAEVKEMWAKHPETVDQPVPTAVAVGVSRGKSVNQAYEEYLAATRGTEKAELEALRKENQTLKQNAEAASRAPVRGVTKGLAVNDGPEDLFLKGFNMPY